MGRDGCSRPKFGGRQAKAFVTGESSRLTAGLERWRLDEGTQGVTNSFDEIASVGDPFLFRKQARQDVRDWRILDVPHLGTTGFGVFGLLGALCGCLRRALIEQRYIF